ncbi:MAG TPA: 50S ribosomal protein L21 [Gaiellaceae bacterium]|nr:50S ribosomal protein L21 [Gaiellaceae bacterium]
MSYAIISVGGKQYRVREGERLLVDRVGLDEGQTFTPRVLLVGGDAAPDLDPSGVTVTARVLGDRRGPKIRIGKYKQRTGYRRHTGFRAALTQIEIESIGAGGTKRAAAKKAAPAAKAKQEAAPTEPAGVEGLPEGYAEMTVADVKAAAPSWDAAALRAALEHERAHGRRKGAIAALESALAGKE